MALVDKLLSGMFGNKSEKDYKDALPLVEKINKIDSQFQELSNDELRAKTGELRTEIHSHFADEQKQIDTIKAKIEAGEIPMAERDKAFAQVDKIENQITEMIESKLLEVLPTAFAIVKNTARRFKENEEIEVTANENDRNLAATREDIHINGDKAIYHNQWMAGGNTITESCASATANNTNKNNPTSNKNPSTSDIFLRMINPHLYRNQ